MKDPHDGIYGKIDGSALMTCIGIILLFSSAVLVTLVAPNFLDPSWHEVSSPYQRQMYEVADPHIYISNSATGSDDIQLVYHLKEGYTLLAFTESDGVRIMAPPELQKFVTPYGEKQLKLTSELLLLRQPEEGSAAFNAKDLAAKRRQELQ
ncbi:MAG: cytochrome oxidase, partial [Chlamydiia bacterium]|nr:cytochrome oxidase [Chlamydiia bacterium]